MGRGSDDTPNSLGRRDTGAQAALPIWLEFMEMGMGGMPAVEFANVVSLEDQAADHNVHVDVPDTAPEEEAPAVAKPKLPSVAPAIIPATSPPN